VRELVAVTNFFAGLNIQTLKRAALMFDRITIPQLSQFTSFIQAATGEYPQEAAEFDWLCEQGILFESAHDKTADLQSEEYRRVDEAAKELQSDFEALLKENDLEEVADIKKEDFVESIDKLKETFGGKISNIEKVVKSEIFNRGLVLGHDYYTRGISIQLRELNGLDAYPILALDIPTSVRKPAGTHDIIDITFNALPVPDENTPWEQIIDFRRDPESKRKFIALKNWTNEVARMQLEAHEVKDKLEVLLNDYREHIKGHKIKTRWDTLRTIVVAEVGFFSSGWLPGIGSVPGVLGMIATPLYSIKQRQLALVEAERNAPGREVAYIIKAREGFGR
jgi:hypothetical protein